jgi:hypothetical protein
MINLNCVWFCWHVKEVSRKNECMYTVVAGNCSYRKLSSQVLDNE